MSSITQELMIESKEVNKEGCYDWIECYALLPKFTISGNMLWLKKCYKRRVRIVWKQPYDVDYVMEYATALDLLK
jgi:hypothetical protein